MKILIACEESQTVCKEFRAKGHEAYSCDIQECSGGHPEWHFNYDVFKVINGGDLPLQNGETVTIDKWDMMVGHPPCTYISFAGNRWLDVKRYGDSAIQIMKNKDEAIEFFINLWNAPIEKICLENPKGYIMRHLPYTQIIHPYYFGDECSKTTCLWLKNLQPLYHNKTENLFDQRVTHVHKGAMTRKSGSEYLFGSYSLSLPKAERSKHRSKTFPGIAKAMAEQWS